MSTRLRLDHVALLVRSLDVSVGFYADVLMLPEIESLVRKPNIRWFGIAEGQSLHLIEGDFGRTWVGFATHFAMSMTTDAFERLKGRLGEKGVSFRNVAGDQNAETSRAADGVRQIYFQDPDGYWIELNNDA